MARVPIYLYEMYKDFAEPLDVEKVLELIRTGKKGVAVHKMATAIYRKWQELMRNHGVPKERLLRPAEVNNGYQRINIL